MKRITLAGMAVAVLASLASAGFVTERIVVEGGTEDVLPGTTVSVLFVLQNNTTPLFGYSLDVDVIPQPDASGSLAVDVLATNFFDRRNLITAGGAIRDPIFSQILDTGDGGVFITTNTDDGSTVLAVAGLNDVLAQVFFDVSAEAFGNFTIELGPASAIGAADFAFTPHTFTVVPEPSTLLLCLAGVAVVRRRRRG